MIDHAPIMRFQDVASSEFAVRASMKAVTAESVYSRIGEKFSDATVFAARSHATFDLEELEKVASTNEMFMSPFQRKLHRSLLGSERVFDTEHPKSALVLNDIRAISYQITAPDPA